MLGHRIELTAGDDGFLLTCPDLPAVVTFGRTEEDARQDAADAIRAILDGMIDEGASIALRDEEPGDRFLALPLMTALKVLLYVSLSNAGIRRAELARRMSCKPVTVDRLLNLDHRSRIDQVEAALAALGRRVDVRLTASASFALLTPVETQTAR